VGAPPLQSPLPRPAGAAAALYAAAAAAASRAAAPRLLRAAGAAAAAGLAAPAPSAEGELPRALAALNAGLGAAYAAGAPAIALVACQGDCGGESWALPAAWIAAAATVLVATRGRALWGLAGALVCAAAASAALEEGAPSAAAVAAAAFGPAVAMLAAAAASAAAARVRRALRRRARAAALPACPGPWRLGVAGMAAPSTPAQPGGDCTPCFWYVFEAESGRIFKATRDLPAISAARFIIAGCESDWWGLHAPAAGDVAAWTLAAALSRGFSGLRLPLLRGPPEGGAAGDGGVGGAFWLFEPATGHVHAVVSDADRAVAALPDLRVAGLCLVDVASGEVAGEDGLPLAELLDGGSLAPLLARWRAAVAAAAAAAPAAC
jgi:hypothetical protein